MAPQPAPPTDPPAEETEETEEPEETEAPTVDPQSTDDLDKLRKALAKANNDAQKHRLRAKELEPLAVRAQELEEANKTEAERLAEAASKATSDAESARLALAKMEAALAKMPPGFDPAGLANVVKRLTGANQKELEADAEELFALLAPQSTPAPTPPPTPGQRPVAKLQPGALPTTPEPNLQDRIAEAEQAGDWAAAGRLKAAQLYQLSQATP